MLDALIDKAQEAADIRDHNLAVRIVNALATGDPEGK